MKKIFLSLIALTLFAIIACASLSACSAGDTKPTVDGVLTEVLDGSGNITGYERRYHNDNGDVTRLDVYDADQVYQSFVTYEYYDDGLLYTETHYQADGIAVSRDVYTYDDSGALAEIAHESPHGDAVVYRYDADGDVIGIDSYDIEGKLEKQKVLENDSWLSYDADGNLIKDK